MDKMMNSEMGANPSPFAKYQGTLKLGSSDVDCYVLDDGSRVLSLASAIKAIANTDAYSIADYIGILPMNAEISADIAAAELIEFSIPERPAKEKGLDAGRFLDVCKVYVSALRDKTLAAEQQKENAIRCSILLGACADMGLQTLIDEACGYQYERREDEWQAKLRLYITEELKAWEQVFPAELWDEIGRLAGAQAACKEHPAWWGKLVIELVYDTLDEDAAKYLRENKPQAGANDYKQTAESAGVRQLISRCYEVMGMAKTCDTVHDLKRKIVQHYRKEPFQLSLPTELYGREYRSSFNKNLQRALNYSEE